MEYADILYWPIFEGRMITAGVMGLVKKFRYILVTEALLDILSPEELDAVIAHEIGHVKRRHLLFYLFFFVGYMLVSYAVLDLILYLIIFTEPIYRFIIHFGITQNSVISVLITVVTLLVFLIYFRYIFGYFMRNFERQADGYVYTFFDTAKPLLSTFEKITADSGQSPDKPNWHHFSITERMGYILKCEKDRSWITKHDQKIRKSIAVYLAGMIFIGWAGYALSSGETGRKITADFERVLHGEIEKNPHNPQLYHLLGDLHHSRNGCMPHVKICHSAIPGLPLNWHCAQSGFQMRLICLILLQKVIMSTACMKRLSVQEKRHYPNPEKTGIFMKSSWKNSGMRWKKRKRKPVGSASA